MIHLHRRIIKIIKSKFESSWTRSKWVHPQHSDDQWRIVIESFSIPTANRVVCLG